MTIDKYNNTMIPIKLFNNKEEREEFVKNVYNTELFSDIIDTGEKMRTTVSGKDVPEWLENIGEKNLELILKYIPEDLQPKNKVWSYIIGRYGRKSGTTIKKKELLFRMIIHIGSTEIYNLTGGQLEGESVVLPDGYALLLSPGAVEDNNLIVYSNPVRKNAKPENIRLAGKIRPRNYDRCTIVLDLSYDTEQN
jgi:hypothetical protein